MGLGGKGRRVVSVTATAAALLIILWFAGAPVVQRALLIDLDADGVQERVLLVWKYGSFGTHRPPWVLRDETGCSQHLFLYQKRADGAWHPLWMSSALGLRVRDIAEGEEIPGTGRPCLVLTETDGTRTRWGWLSWGMVRVE